MIRLLQITTRKFSLKIQILNKPIFIKAVEVCDSSSFLVFDILLKLSRISTDNRFLENLKAQCDFGKKKCLLRSQLL